MEERLALKIKGVTFALLYIGVYLFIEQCVLSVVTALEADMFNYGGIASLLSALLSACVLFVILYLRDIDVKRYVRIRRISLLDVVLSLSLAIGYRIVTSVYLKIAEAVPMFEESLKQMTNSEYDFTTMTVRTAVAFMVSVCIAGPLFEELLFRGLVFKELSSAMNVYVAIVLQALLFGFAHNVLLQGIFSAVLGIILGVLYYKTKNVAVISLVHVFFNCTAFLEIRNLEDIVQLGFVGLTMTFASLAIFLYIYRKRR